MRNGYMQALHNKIKILIWKWIIKQHYAPAVEVWKNYRLSAEQKNLASSSSIHLLSGRLPAVEAVAVQVQSCCHWHRCSTVLRSPVAVDHHQARPDRLRPVWNRATQIWTTMTAEREEVPPSSHCQGYRRMSDTESCRWTWQRRRWWKKNIDCDWQSCSENETTREKN